MIRRLVPDPYLLTGWAMADESNGRNRSIPSETHLDDTSSSDPAQLEASILASASDDARALSPDHDPEGDGTGRIVLVVAADPDMRTYVRQCLAHVTSIRVMEASDTSALERIAQAMAPDLVVVDVDGDPAGTAVERLMSHRLGLNDVPLIIITDELPNNDRGQVGTGSAPEAILVKPFNARRLCAEVRRLLVTENP